MASTSQFHPLLLPGSSQVVLWPCYGKGERWRNLELCDACCLQDDMGSPKLLPASPLPGVILAWVMVCSFWNQRVCVWFLWAFSNEMETFLVEFKKRQSGSSCVEEVLTNWGNGLESKQRHGSLVWRSSGQLGSNLPICTLTNEEWLGKGSTRRLQQVTTVWDITRIVM